MEIKLILLTTMLTGSLCLSAGKTLIIFNPDTQTKNFTMLGKYRKLIRKVKDTDTKPAGLKSSMLIDTLAQNTKKQYWYVFNGCSWDGKRGNTATIKSHPFEIEFFILPAEAMNLPGSQTAPKYMNKQSVLRFCFGSGERNQSVKVGLRRSFFQKTSKGKVIPRPERTGKWLTLSIKRNKSGIPVKLSVRQNNKEIAVPAGEYYIAGQKNKPNWRSSNFTAIESWGESPDNFQFNIGRISIVPEQ